MYFLKLKKFVDAVELMIETPLTLSHVVEVGKMLEEIKEKDMIEVLKRRNKSKKNKLAKRKHRLYKVNFKRGFVPKEKEVSVKQEIRNKELVHGE